MKDFKFEVGEKVRVVEEVIKALNNGRGSEKVFENDCYLTHDMKMFLIQNKQLTIKKKKSKEQGRNIYLIEEYGSNWDERWFEFLGVPEAEEF